MRSTAIPLRRAYQGKVVLVTGHTGFKGSWLCTWLEQLGARVVGYALEPPSEPAMFDLVSRSLIAEDHRGDVRDIAAFGDVVRACRPDVVFHLAAQPLVRRSYEDPAGTYSTNVVGTMNLLEILRGVSRRVVVINVTSDKCYVNHEWVYGYREDDALGGSDPYSSSKACSEILTAAYRSSFFSAGTYGTDHAVSLATARAGNVIGGGDWAQDRLVPDCVRSLSRSQTVVIRSPRATRPWQHVLEPISGYLWLGACMIEQPADFAESWNFGPSESSVRTVRDLVEALIAAWGSGSYEVTQDPQPHEASFLKLDISKVCHRLRWQPVLPFEEAVQWTTAWYRLYYQRGEGDLAETTHRQIEEYVQTARRRSLPWAAGEA